MASPTRAEGATTPKAKTLKERAYDLIRFDVITFKLRPGETISESQLAKQHGLGIAPIRSALALLSQEGLVIARKRIGHTVAPVTVNGIKNIDQLRLLLEPPLAEQNAGKIDVALLQRLDQETSAQADPDDPEAELRSIMANRALHLAIAEPAGNPQLQRWLGQLLDQAIRFHYLMRHFDEDLSDWWAHSHVDIIEALAAGDGVLANRLMREHILEGNEIVMQVVYKLPEVQNLRLGSISK